jgi:hypothetical protein
MTGMRLRGVVYETNIDDMAMERRNRESGTALRAERYKLKLSQLGIQRYKLFTRRWWGCVQT